MEKKKNLTAALSKPPAPPAEAEAPDAAPRRAASPEPRPDRAGKTNVTGYFDMPVKWELQDLATERSRQLRRKVTVQELLAEALNDLFKKYGKAEIATRGRSKA